MSAFEEWLATRPPVIQDLGSRFPPDVDYGMNQDGDVYRIYSYNENGTVTVTRFMQGCPVWNVFGVDPAQLYI